MRRALSVEYRGKRMKAIKNNRKKEAEPPKRAGAFQVLYIFAVIGICLIPFAMMRIRPTTQTTENKTLAEKPALVDENGFNRDFLSDAGDYFSDHFAFRQELVAADAKLRSALFGVSAVDSVIQGKNGWLYYEATLDDYQHKNGVSDRMLFNMAHNTALMQEYAQLLGKTFVFTIAPNKNSLYGENMPERYHYTVAEESDAARLVPWLEKEGVHYVDLFRLFEEQEGVLYYARDSHWNQEGAVLVYNALLDACGIEHETWENVEKQVRCDYYGDLNLMLYPVGAVPEEDVHFEKEFTYAYSEEGATVEDTFIQTVNPQGSGNLLMYRDSFGNSLLPYMAQHFANAVFSKVVPYPMTDLVTAAPDVVIVEKVERHLPTLGEVPPVMSGLARTLGAEPAAVRSKTTLQMTKEGSYLKFSGIADEAFLDVDGRLYVEVDDGETAGIYEAFCVKQSGDGVSSDYGFVLYLSQLYVNNSVIQVKVIAEKDGQFAVIYEGKETIEEKNK